MLTSMASTGGGGDYFTIRRSLQGEVNQSIGKLENLLHQVFRQITYFQEKLDGQSGLAASKLKKSLNEHLEIMNKSANALLHFSDTVNSLIVAIESTDDGSTNIIMPRSRMEWQYSLSVERVEEEIVLAPGTMRQAALQFQTNLVNIDELFSEFTTLLNKVTEASHLPWGNFRGIWSEAIYKVEQIAEETTNQIQCLINDTNEFVYEMGRLDHMAGAAMIQM